MREIRNSRWLMSTDALDHGGHGRRGKHLLGFLCVLGVLCGGEFVRAQAPAFDVASIKPSAPDAPRGGFGISPSGLFQVQGISLVELIQGAYSDGRRPFYRFQVSGGPDWLDSARFDITASSTLRNPSAAQTMAMVKGMLVDRFKVIVRQETRDAPIYALTLAAKDGTPGPKLRKSSAPCDVR